MARGKGVGHTGRKEELSSQAGLGTHSSKVIGIMQSATSHVTPHATMEGHALTRCPSLLYRRRSASLSGDLAAQQVSPMLGCQKGAGTHAWDTISVLPSGACFKAVHELLLGGSQEGGSLGRVALSLVAASPCAGGEAQVRSGSANWVKNPIGLRLRCEGPQAAA